MFFLLAVIVAVVAAPAAAPAAAAVVLWWDDVDLASTALHLDEPRNGIRNANKRASLTSSKFCARTRHTQRKPRRDNRTRLKAHHDSPLL